MKRIEYTDTELIITQELEITAQVILVLTRCKVLFASNTGITSLGVIMATDCSFEPLDERSGWKGIADIGKGRSSFNGCYFRGGRGRTLFEFKDQFVSRYFKEIDDIEITQNWSEFSLEEQQSVYHEGTYGGALVSLNASIVNSIFQECRATQEGGAVLATFNVDIEQCQFLRCRAGMDGGAVSVLSNGKIKNCYFESCRARDEGGAVILRGFSSIRGVFFKKCIARNGGAIASHAKSFIDECAFLRCIATHFGGGINGEIQGSRLLFYKCIANWSGAIHLVECSNITHSKTHRCIEKH